MQTNIMIVESRCIIREGLKQIIEPVPSLKVIAEASTCAEALTGLREHPCQLMLLGNSDHWLNELTALRQIKSAYPHLRVLLVVIDMKRGLYGNPLAKHVDDCLPMDNTIPLLQVIHTLTSGKRKKHGITNSAPIPQSGEGAQHKRLSVREFEVLSMIEQGRTINQIADLMKLSPKTVSTYRIRLLAKLECENNAQLILYALQNSLSQ